MNLTNHILEDQLLGNYSNLLNFLRPKRHKSYVGEVMKNEPCYRPSFEENVYDYCDFVANSETCSKPAIFFNYLKFVVCVLQLDTSDRGLVLAALTSVAITTLYITMLYVIAKYFLLPNCMIFLENIRIKPYDFTLVILSAISQFPKISGNLCTCYHFTSTFALLNSNRICRIFNSILFSTILIGKHSKGVKMRGLHLLREVIFVAIGTSLWHGTLIHDMYNTNENADVRTGPIVIYMSYVGFAIFAVYLFNIALFWTRKAEPKELSSVPQSSESLHSDDYPNALTYPKDHDINPCWQFLDNINPFLNIRNGSLAYKIYLCPFFVIAAFLIPVVRTERPLYGWSKILFAFSFICWPMHFAMSDLSSTYLIAILILTLLGLIIVLFLTNAKRLPKFHKWISLWGLIVGFILINIIDAELNVIFWQFLHYIFNWYDDTVVLTSFSIGSVFVESAFVIHFSKLGYNDMAFGFIMGTSIILSYCSIMLLPISLCFYNNQYFVITAPTTTTYMFYYLVLVFLLFSLSSTNFIFRQSHSFFFLSVCILYYTMILLFQYDIIHPYGTMHQLNVYPDSIHGAWA